MVIELCIVWAYAFNQCNKQMDNGLSLSFEGPYISSPWLLLSFSSARFRKVCVCPVLGQMFAESVATAEAAVSYESMDVAENLWAQQFLTMFLDFCIYWLRSMCLMTLCVWLFQVSYLLNVSRSVCGKEDRCKDIGTDRSDRWMDVAHMSTRGDGNTVEPLMLMYRVTVYWPVDLI